MSSARIVRLNDLHGIAALLAESESSGYRFLRRLVDEWESGVNRFDQRGEALFAAMEEGAVVGLCGLNVDPYSEEPSVGRLRHLYVLRDSRGRGIGGQLVGCVLDAAAGTFDEVRLRTDTEAASFYERLGFVRVSKSSSSTHAFRCVAVRDR